MLALYPARSEGFTSAEIAVAELLAIQAAGAIVSIRTATQLSAAIGSRTLIGQAQGMVMERCAIGADEAFALLRRYSQDHNIKLLEVARSLTTTGQLPGVQLVHLHE